ncbi:Transglycosylase SLT domain-containing protein [Loktanella fryxellensis]|uniref:Transglycosylase SLT domain-containing protein n=1 Tax=Loktanella fryxellensis TaxID=245187 RepID=A0A1H7Z793_9RHOB|nr:lytic transglycosylase domain-containing protein [Loktanella fryxellensis]SEM54206.1 Transglycosylase SLT domain-containing protein [Loktanella fryxellensis]
MISLVGLSACMNATSTGPDALAFAAAQAPLTTPLHANETRELRTLIQKYAAEYDIPESLLHRVIIRESRHNPAARNGPYYGLMQILPATAGTMGFRGAPTDLLDAETNLKYAGKYLRGAWLLSNGSEDTAVKWYSQGYYYEAKARGMLVETGLRT